MVGGEHDHRFVVEIRFPEDLDQSGDPLVDPGNALIVVGEFLAGFRGIRKEGRNRYFFRIVEHFFDSFMGFAVGLVAEKIGLEIALGSLVLPSSAMRVGGREIQKEGLFAFLSDEFTRLFGHLDGVAGVSAEVSLVVEDFFRRDVVFSNVSGPVTRIRHGPGEGQSDDVVITRELVKGVLVPVLAVGVVVQTAHHDRSAGRATGGGGKGVEEKRPVLRPGHRWPGSGQLCLHSNREWEIRRR